MFALSGLSRLLCRILNLRPGELGVVTGFWVFYALLIMMLTMGEGVALSLFIKRVGVASLPGLLIAVAGVNAVAALAYTFTADRVDNRRVLIVLLALAGASFLVTYLATPIAALGTLPYYLFFVFRESAFALLIMHFGLYIRDFYGRADSERTFPVIYASGRVGGILAGAVLAVATPWVGTLHLTLLYTALAFACIGLVVCLEALAHPVHKVRPQGAEAFTWAVGWRNFREGLRFVRGSQLMMAMSLATFLFVILRYFLNYEYSSAFQAAFPSEDQLTRFLGTYAIVALALATGIQLVVTSRLIQRWGVGAINTVFAALMAVGFGVVTAMPVFATALVARFVETELRMSLRNPVMNLFYNAVPDAMRARSRAFTFGFVLPLGTVAAGLLLQVLLAGPGHVGVRMAGLVLSGVFVWLSWRQGQAYRDALAMLEGLPPQK